MLELCPSRTTAWEEKAGNVVVHVPRHPPMGRVARLFGKEPYVRLKLDELGSFVWLRCDGKTRTDAIAKDLGEAFEGSPEDLTGRLALFLNRLARERLITWEEIS